MKKFFWIFVAILIILVIYSEIFPKKRETRFVALGSVPFRVVVYGRSKNKFKEDMQGVYDLVDRLENLFSKKLPGSELALVNSNKKNKISKELGTVILNAKDWNRKTQGAFDPTVGPIISLWIKSAKKNKIPTEADIAKARAKTGAQKIDIKNNIISFDTNEMTIDLGGIAKGTIVDAVANLLINRGVKRGFVDGGGDIKLFGGEEFVLGIKHPKSDGLIERLKCLSGGIVTSGNYARYSVIEGRKFSHIIDPRTGWPLEEGPVSVTVTAPNAEDTDALATAFMVLGQKDGFKILDELPSGYGAVFLINEGDEILVKDHLENSNCSLME